MGRLQEEKEKLKKEIKEKTIGYVLAAFGLVAGLAWNDAVRSLIATFFPNPGDEVLPKIIYAVGITIVVIIISVYLARLIAKKE